ncbi:hypothetical protein GOP47_0009349 [Adiantum capillus-veneris]|uniref:Uncharacterized protein n=1 Tax=Adiantum capillus-veneris TaxID=13818 RepID=A0A9D4UXC6_ADICA|nr:hypothetical protein GOP47_0009349 [Adiantum capillus-veneris]
MRNYINATIEGCTHHALPFWPGFLSSSFPIENRAILPTLQHLKSHLDRMKNAAFVKRISDFHLLLLLAKYLDVPQLAEVVRNQGAVPEGYQINIDSFANSS